jgi:DNA-binding NarL/FixJ family response regulator
MTAQVHDRVETSKRKVFVVDDHPIVREGLTLLINRETDLAVCGVAEETHSALRTIEILKPDILIVDLSLNGPDGLDLLKIIRAKDPGLPVLILSMHDESIYAERALRAGANGYIMKQEATERVLVALRSILTALPTRCSSNIWALPAPRGDRLGTISPTGSWKFYA